MANKLLMSKSPLRIKDLSVEYGVSTRTIKYDLELVRDWYKTQNRQLHSQTNKGIWLECSDQDRILLRRTLTQSERANIYPDQTIRVRKMIFALLLTNEYITAAKFSESLEVSRNTVLNDLNKVEEFLLSWGIDLERKQRIGYKLLGEELQIRLMLEHLIYHDLDDFEIYKMTTRITKKVPEEDTGLLIDDALKDEYKAIEQQMKELYDSSLANLMRVSDLLKSLFRITFSVIRLNMGYTIKSYRVLDRSKLQDEGSKFLASVMEKVLTEMQLPLLEEEFLYISGGLEKEFESLDAVAITEKIIHHVSKLERIDYQNDPKLNSNLLAHLSLRFQNGSFYLKEMNPMEEEIKRNHPELFKHVQEACHRFIKHHALIAQDSFTSLIVLHFLVSYENTFKPKRKVKVLYVCSTGRGAARLIKNRVEKEIPAVEIVGYCSLLDVEEICQNEKVDMIVSVFPVETKIPVVVVEPLPGKSDIEAIRAQMKKLIGSEAIEVNQLLEDQKAHTINDDAESLSQEIILKGFEATQALLEAFPIQSNQNWKNAFEIHVFLMVHRYYFDKQYDHYFHTSQQLLEGDMEMMNKVRSILEDKDLHVNNVEVFTLLQYFKKWEVMV
ncbi:BglG family transcription antiterminator [Cytobacillus sp. NCCP-133]|uniref:BglG family transcription antiterminator n=1 Tax=Cytobacillus sp. NCCP-133 TaxID=766848 RepID=UPI002231324F|nr:HTH domain-containing protein [Cytobacillus sp. NCCP-133]GLB60158.1 transcriptional antiterminator [Cytobacillus sp. NCCP-133]